MSKIFSFTRSHSSLRSLRVLVSTLTISSGVACISPSFAAPGDPLGPAIDIRTIVTATTPTGTAQGAAVVARDAAGNYVVAWQASAEAIGTAVFARVFRADGSPLSEQFELAGFVRREYSSFTAPLALAVAPNGRFVVAFTGAEPLNFTPRVLALGFERDGTPIGSATVVAEGERPVFEGFRSSVDLSSVSAAITGEGYTVSWSQNTDVTLVFLAGLNTLVSSWTVVRSRSLRFDGTPLTDVRDVAARSLPSNGGDQRRAGSPIVVGSPTGGHLVAWEAYPDGAIPPGNDARPFSPYRVRFYSASGASLPLSSVLETGQDGSRFLAGGDFVVGYAGNGDLVMAWPVLERSQRSGGVFTAGPQHLYTRRYSPLGVPRGAPVEVAIRSPVRSSPRATMSIAALPNGGYALAWADEGTTARAYGRYFGADGEPVSAVFPIAPGDVYPSVSITTDHNGDLIATYGSVLIRRYEGPRP